ncbi:uncharacterized protein LOC107781541 [Nicotiana tabacum]|uniref:Uncharacterized protein LOC107781541 n=1 Tax=Nicotiana tabacum TaxID=4097 RepID=A0A1S3Z0T8_TOBAC|nr:PREDICTED: uncharacterized protein LOC107781541 [Nicotiana tabacum]
MQLQTWTPTFKANEDSPVIPTWVIVPELPWHLYYMEVFTVLLSPIGKVLHLDVASMQKTRGSAAKVKMQIDLTKSRPHYVWLGFDEEQDENGDGQWIEVEYEYLPNYCLQCKHLGHSMQQCPTKKKEEEGKKQDVAEASGKQDNQSIFNNVRSTSMQ